jgi:hypothetical protein
MSDALLAAVYSSNISDICAYYDPVPLRPDDYPLDAVDLAVEDADELSVTHLLVHLIAIDFLDAAPSPARSPLKLDPLPPITPGDRRAERFAGARRHRERAHSHRSAAGQAQDKVCSAPSRGPRTRRGGGDTCARRLADDAVDHGAVVDLEE